MTTPATLPDTPNVASGPTIFLSNMFTTLSMSVGMNKMITDILNAWTKLGIGTSTPAAGQALFGTSSGSVWDTTARKNRLMNGDGRVKQRAVMPTVTNSYAIDGMRLLMESANGWTIAQELTDVPAGSPAAYKFTVGATNNAKGGGFWPIIQHDMIDIRSAAAALASAQFKHKVSNARIADIRWALIQRTSGTVDTFANPVSAWGAAGTNPTLADGWSYITIPAAIVPTAAWSSAVKLEAQAVSSAANALGLLIWCDDKTTTTGDSLLISGLQVEKGAVCTDLDWLPYPQQLANCEHWLQVFPGARYPFRAVGSASSTTAGDFGPLVKRRMRIGPALTVTAADWAAVQGGSVFPFSALSLLYSQPGAVWLQGAATGLTVLAPLALSSSTGGSLTDLILSAEP